MSRTRNALILVTFLAGLAACAPQDGPVFESTLSFGQANSILVNETNESRRAYAVRQLDRLARQGDARATAALANGYERGQRGLPVDPVRAASYLELLDAQGNAGARGRLIRLYGDAEGAAYDPARQEALLRTAFEEGDDRSGIGLARLYDDRGDAAAAREVRIALHARGSNPAGHQLARTYLDEDGGYYDPVAALAIYEELIQRGDVNAFRGVAGLYMRGLGVERDMARGYAYLEQGFAAGDANAGVALANLMMLRNSEFSDPDRGMALFEELAGEGVPGAWIQLSRRAPETYIARAQQVLAAQGRYDGPIDGQADAATRDALSLWCIDAGISGDCSEDPYMRDVAVAMARAVRDAAS